MFREVSDQQGEERALLEELSWSGVDDAVPESAVSVGERLKGGLGEEQRAWAVRAEELWKGVLRDLVASLEGVTDAEEWVCGRGFRVRSFLEVGLVKRFEEVCGAKGSRCLFGVKDPDTELPGSYRLLCEHLDGKREDAVFLPAVGMHGFLDGCTREVRAYHANLVRSLDAAFCARYRR